MTDQDLQPHDLLLSMRADEVQSDAAIAAFVRGVVDQSITQAQAATWLTHVYRRGLTDAETVTFTRCMTDSGDRLSWPKGSRIIDKHSTGGVGDKISLILAPLWAELGYRVPMISGRGLGHTGGTLDKLESIPDFRTDLPVERLAEVLDQVGFFMCGQTTQLAPADRTLYALRNETCTVESIPLIVASILSKKLAEGLDELVLDVKTGSGAFMAKEEDARALAEALVRVAKGAGLACSALITAMDRPLGSAVGNAVEVIESIQVLRGEGPADVRAVTLALANHPDAEKVLRSGAAYERFCRMVEAQGGDRAALEDPSKLRGAGAGEAVALAERSGFVTEVNARAVGDAAFVLGAGRERAQDPVDHGVGLWMHVSPGEKVDEGQPIATLLHRNGRKLDLAFRKVHGAVRIEDEPAPVGPLIVDRID